MNKTVGLIVGLAMATFAMSACGTSEKTTSSSEASQGYPVTIDNYTRAEGGTDWTKKAETFDEKPTRVVANTRPAAELLLHLGLKDQIAGVGATFGAADTSVEKEFNELKDLGNSYIGKETALSVDPDLIYGRGGLFDNQDWGVGTVDSLNDMGVKTYVLESSITGATFDSVYQDIKNTGKIFDKEAEAKTFAAEIKTREDAVKESVKDQKVQTFAYLHMSDPTQVVVYSAHDEPFFNDLFKMVKLDNVFKDQTGDVSEETLIETDPDVLIVGDWSTIKDSVSGQQVIDALYKNPKLASMQAIKNKKVYAVDYNYLFGYGYQSLTGIEELVKQMN